MTLVNGTVQDLGYDGMEGTLWARPARFRSDGQVVLAPERKPFKITGGVVSAELAPGPAVLELQVGSHARDTFEVVIPDTAITLADLLDTVFPWEPAQVSQFVAERELAVQAKTAAETAAGQASTAAGTATTAAQQTEQDRTAVAADKQVVVGHVQALAAPNDAAVLGLISEGATTQTKAALDATYADKPDNGEKAVGKGELFVIDTDHPTLEDALTAVASGGTLEVRQAYSRTLPFVINKPCEVRFRGGSLTQTTASSGISVQSNDVTIDRPQITGAGASTFGTFSGIVADGTVSAYRERITVIRPRISGFDKCGIDLGFCRDFFIDQPKISQVTYAGVMMRSCEDGHVRGGAVNGVTQTGAVNSYGVTATRSNGELATHPRSKNITVHGMSISGVQWVGMDTHGGENIRFVENVVTGCQTGISMVSTVGSGADHGPRNCLVRGNTVDAAGATVTIRKGIEFQGVGTSSASSELATGWITDNRVIGYGADNEAWSDASIKLWNTMGVSVKHNLITSPAGCAILVTGQNHGFTLAGNTAVDMWRTAGGSPRPCFMVVDSGTAVGTLSGNRVLRGAKDGTGLVVNTHGVLLAAGTQNSVTISDDNDFSACTVLQVQDVSVITKASGVARKVGFYGATPTAKPTAVPVTADGIHSALVSLGLIAS